MKSPYDFPVEWHKQLLAKAKADMLKYEKYLSALKVKESNYYKAHQVVAEMSRKAYEAMLTVPAPKPMGDEARLARVIAEIDGME